MTHREASVVLWRRPILVIMLGSVLACLGSGSATAQVIDQYFPAFVGGLSGDSVLDRGQPEFQSEGIRTGSFIIRPRVQESVGYETDADGIPHGHASPVIVSQAGIDAGSDWLGKSLSAAVSVIDQRFTARPIQDSTDWTASIGGNYEIGHDNLAASYSHLALSTQPGAIGAGTLNHTLAYSVDDVRLGYTIAGSGKFSLTPDFEFRAFRFQSSDLGGGVNEDQHDRNVEQFGLTTRYEFSPQRSALLVLRGTRIDYVNLPGGTISGSSNGLTILTGLDYAAAGVFRYRVLVGYQFRAFDSSQLSSLSAPIIEAAVVWTPTRQAALTLSLRRDIEDATDESLSGFTYTAARLAGRYELLRNVLLNGSIGLTIGNYRATGAGVNGTVFAQASGTQTVYDGNLGVSVLLNRNLRASLTDSLSVDRGSGSGLGSFTNNTLLLSLTFQL